MSKAGRAAIAILVAAAVLWLAGWLDGTVMLHAENPVTGPLEMSGFMAMVAVGSLAVSGSVLLLGVLAWRSQSALVGAAYAIVGAFFAALQWILVTLVVEINGAPILPRPIADGVQQIYVWAEGPLRAVETIGAGMAVIGVVVIGRSLRARMVGRRVEPVTGIEGQPVRP